MVELQVMIERVPDSNERGVHTPRELDTLALSGETYEAAKAQISERMPDGWRTVWIRTLPQ